MTEEIKYRSVGEIVIAQDIEAFRRELPKYVLKDQSEEGKSRYQRDLDIMLWHASCYKNTEMAEELIKKGANVEFEYNNTKAIYNAVDNFEFKMVETLVKNGANVNDQDGMGRNLLVRMYDNEATSIEATSVIPSHLIPQQISGAISGLLNNNKKEEDPKEKLVENIIKMTDTLVNLNINVSEPTLSGKTALHYACYNNNQKLVETLVRHDIDPTIETFSDSAVASEYLPEQSDELFEKLENYREAYLIRKRNPNNKKSNVKMI